jgi:hypothetical protein
MYLLFALSARLHGDFEASDGFVIYTSFGFESGGSYNATFSNWRNPNREYCFALVPTSEASSVRHTVPCDSFLYSSIVGNGTSSIEGTVDVAGIYHPYVAIHDASSLYISYTIDSFFWNPNSRLDSRWRGVLPAKIVIVCFHFILLILWFINWGMHFSIQIWIHYFLTAVFTSGLLYQCTSTFEFYSDNLYEDRIAPYVIREIFSVISMGLFFGTIILIAKGWCIIRDSIPCSAIVRALIYPFLLIIVTFLLGIAENVIFAAVMLVLSVVVMVLLMRELLISTKDAFLHIIARLLAIADQGINARSTPIWQKYRLYRRFQFSMLAASILIIIYAIVDLIIGLDYLPGEVIVDVLIFAVFAMLAFIFRLRGQAQSNYLRIGDDEQTAGEVRLADIEGIDVNSERFDGGREWQEGMPLPGQPEIIRQPEQLLIESPEGRATVEAGVERV